MVKSKELRKMRFSGVNLVSIIEFWYLRSGYIKSMADLIQKELSSFSNPEEVMIFFSAHGVPLSYVEDAGDLYRDQMEECITLIMNELKSRGISNNHTLVYLSGVGPVQWLKPYTDEVIVELGQKGVKSFLAVPVRPPPVKVGACKALSQLLPESNQDVIQPHIMGVLSSLVDLLRQASDETLHLVLKTLQAAVKAESSAEEILSMERDEAAMLLICQKI